MGVGPDIRIPSSGKVPVEWKIAKVKDVSNNITVGFVGQMAHLFVRDGVPLLRGQNILPQKLDLNNLKFISRVTHHRWKKSEVLAKDVAIVRVGYPGTACPIPEGLGELNAASLVLVRPNQAYLNSDYFAYVLNSPWGRARIDALLVGGAQQVINTLTTADFEFPLPPIEEQHAIVAALRAVDNLIEGLTQLITKKRDLKQAAMQQLLTGQRRLPGFSGTWVVRPLGEVIDHCSSGATPYRGRPEFYKGNVKWITSSELNYNIINDTVEHISMEAVEKSNLKIHPVGTFLIAITGLEAAGTRGSCGIVGRPAATNQSCMAIYPSSELLTEYLFHYYVLQGNSLAFKYCQGTKQQSYTAKLVKRLPIDLPPSIEEQRAIATVLSDMDAELATLEARRDKTRDLKLGMMQELLTGRIRLV